MYFLRLDEKNNIVEYIMSDVPVDNAIEVTNEEFSTANKYIKFNPDTREFSEEIPEVVTPKTTDEKVDEIKADTTTISSDNLLNMDMIVSLDEKLNKIIKHLGI